MIEIGRLCVKLAGRDSGRKCVIVDVIDDNFVMIDGDARRRKCNILHLEPLDKKMDVDKTSSRPHIVSEFKKLGIELKEKKPKQKKPRQLRKRKSKLAKKQAVKISEEKLDKKFAGKEKKSE